MTQTHQPQIAVLPRRRVIAAVVVVAGLVAAWTALSVAGVRQLGRWPAAAVPFGVNRVLIVHLLGVLPLSVWTGRQIVRLLGARRAVALTMTVLGLIVTGGSILAADAVRRYAESLPPFYWNILRLAWSWLLLLPWSTAAASAFVASSGLPENDAATRQHTKAKRGPGSDHSRRALMVLADGVIATLFAYLPVIYVQQIIERQSALVADAATNQQYVQAWQIAQQMVGLGAPDIAGQPSRPLVDELAAIVQTLQQRVASPLPADASTQQRLSRANQLYSLARFEEVTQLLDSLPDDPRAQLRLAMCDEAQRLYASAAERYGRTIEILQQNLPLAPDDLPVLRSAYERRVNNLRRIGQSRQAESELLEGLQQWPQARDAMLMQLGFHYQMAGRSREAVDFYQQAAAANPQLKEQADAAIAQLRNQAEGCLLRSTRGATR
jgi:tetratricopeptide (TPR) repeat protein